MCAAFDEPPKRLRKARRLSSDDSDDSACKLSDSNNFLIIYTFLIQYYFINFCIAANISQISASRPNQHKGKKSYVTILIKMIFKSIATC